jgi:hypothetical protein
VSKRNKQPTKGEYTMTYYSIEFVSNEGQRFGADALTEAEAMDYLKGYMTYTGRIRLWNGMTLVLESQINKPLFVNTTERK